MKYQGREFRTYLQAPTERKLSQMVVEQGDYARKVGTGPIEVLQKGRDPDGGWEATVIAHNWNPFKWIRKKVKGKPKEEEEEEKALVPYSYRFQEEWEKEPPVEGKFREKTEEVSKEKPDKEEVKTKEELLRIRRKERELAQKKLDLLEAELRAEKRRAGEDVWGRAARTAGRAERVAGALYKVGTLGGSPKTVRKDLYLPRAGKGYYVPPPKKELYVPEPRKELYVPGAPRKTSIGGPLKEVSTPKLESLRRQGELSTGPRDTRMSPVRQLTERPISVRGMGPSPLATTGVGQTHGLISSKGEGAAMALLREMGMPRGLSMMEKAAFAEIRDNNDRDTLQHISSELAGLGIARKDAEKAVGNLLRKGLVKEVVERKGERPIYEVAR